jgi:hypothetical protein
MRLVSFNEFKKVYQGVVRAVYGNWTLEMQEEMARYCYGWNPCKFNFKTYLEASVLRYYHAYQTIAESGDYHTICDIGGFWGVFPITLKLFGFEVTLTESLKYYGCSFKNLFSFIRSQGVHIIDYDPFHPGRPPGRYHVITAMAILEHFPYSLMVFMDNLLSMMERGSRLYIEVPNIAYWPKRIGLLRGQTPLTPIQDIYRSEAPFIGHHHEFTISELRDLAELSNLRIVKELFYTYSVTGSTMTRLFQAPVATFIQFICPPSRECLAVLCQRKEEKISNGQV